MTELLPPLNLASFFEVTPERFNRKAIVQQPGVKVVHLTLAPGQELPPHRHPGAHVLLQGLVGTTTVQLEDKATELLPAHLFDFSGELQVSLRNEGDGPSALLVTLVKHLDDKER